MQMGSPMSEEEALNEAESIKEKLQQSLGEGIFPNWIGPQRFGSGSLLPQKLVSMC